MKCIACDKTSMRHAYAKGLCGECYAKEAKIGFPRGMFDVDDNSKWLYRSANLFFMMDYDWLVPMYRFEGGIFRPVVGLIACLALKRDVDLSEISYRDGSPTNLRWSNIIIAEPEAPIKGVSKSGRRWQARLKGKSLGYFDTQEEATQAYRKAKSK